MRVRNPADLSDGYTHNTVSRVIRTIWRGARVAEWGALLRRCPCKADRGFKSLPLRQFRRVLVVAVVAVATPSTSVVSAASCTQHHTARPNDSWTRLAARFKTPLPELLALNDATSRTPLFIGDRVCVSAQSTVKKPSSIEQFTRKQSRAIIREVWPDDLEDTALFVAQRESNFVHSVVGGKGGCCVGLFQIYWSVHRSWLAAAGVTTAEQLLNPRINAEAALALYRRNGNSWRPWWTNSWRP
jgi:hypothetical protein